jgi:Tfp pilus assembly protein PilE
MPLSTLRRLLVSIARGAGLTLLELGALCAVLAVAAYFAVPSWHQHRLSLRRVEARSELVALAQRLDGCHKALGVYDDAACTVELPVTTATGAYRVDGQLHRDGWSLVAHPLDEQQRDACGALGLDDHGARKAHGGLPAAECWGPED